MSEKMLLVAKRSTTRKGKNKVIKEGQIYEDCDGQILAVTALDNLCRLPEDHVIFNSGQVCDGYMDKDFDNYCNLIAEYPTWREAIDSKEFKYGRI